MTWHRGTLAAGIFFFLVGVVFLLDRLGVWEVRGTLVWPLLLIVVGVAIIAGGRTEKEPADVQPPPDERPPA
ncbi:MAG: LiaF transmembrane domain-containing protein [Actinomycetota bacterium]|jgi:drug/metabolite transporter (DMT)-like permease